MLRISPRKPLGQCDPRMVLVKGEVSTAAASCRFSLLCSLLCLPPSSSVTLVESLPCLGLGFRSCDGDDNASLRKQPVKSTPTGNFPSKSPISSRSFSFLQQEPPREFLSGFFHPTSEGPSPPDPHCSVSPTPPHPQPPGLVPPCSKAAQTTRPSSGLRKSTSLTQRRIVATHCARIHIFLFLHFLFLGLPPAEEKNTHTQK